MRMGDRWHPRVTGAFFFGDDQPIRQEPGDIRARKDAAQWRTTLYVMYGSHSVIPKIEKTMKNLHNSCTL